MPSSLTPSILADRRQRKVQGVHPRVETFRRIGDRHPLALILDGLLGAVFALSVAQFAAIAVKTLLQQIDNQFRRSVWSVRLT
jgi:hypothetical protein